VDERKIVLAVVVKAERGFLGVSSNRHCGKRFFATAFGGCTAHTVASPLESGPSRSSPGSNPVGTKRAGLLLLLRRIVRGTDWRVNHRRRQIHAARRDRMSECDQNCQAPNTSRDASSALPEIKPVHETGKNRFSLL